MANYPSWQKHHIWSPSSCQDQVPQILPTHSEVSRSASSSVNGVDSVGDSRWMGLLSVSWRCSAYLLHIEIADWSAGLNIRIPSLTCANGRCAGEKKVDIVVVRQYLKNKNLSPGTSKNEFLNFATILPTYSTCNYVKIAQRIICDMLYNLCVISSKTTVLLKMWFEAVRDRLYSNFQKFRNLWYIRVVRVKNGQPQISRIFTPIAAEQSSNFICSNQAQVVKRIIEYHLCDV